MSGLARILKAHGHEVTGSDRERTQFTESLDEAGIPYTVGHTGALLEGADAVIYSAAIRPDNPERVLAAERGIPQLERSEALGQLSERFSQVVAVAGCHGKTTITSMLALIADAADADATVHVGGYVDALRGGVRVGGRGLFITEACEYVESFLTLSPTIALISNIDNDHLDYFHDMAHIEAAFEKFLDRLPQDGVFVACTDDARVRALYEASARRAVSYGLAGGDYTAADIAYDGQGCPAFTAVRHGAALGRVQAAKPGAYASRWEGQLQELYDRIAERGDFSYDLGRDPVYRQAREQYQTAGRLAMQDTMGQAAALTGGYGSSYGQQTGQQAYNAYLQQLNEIVPELYVQAREQWQSGEAALYNRNQLLSSREQSDYARYRDQMSDYYAELDDARSAYASAAKLANDNYWSSLEYQADREDAANAQYWKQLAYADKQAAAAEAAAKAAQNAAAKSTGTAAGSRKQKTASSKAGGRSTGVKKTRSSAWTSGQAELN